MLRLFPAQGTYFSALCAAILDTPFCRFEFIVTVSDDGHVKFWKKIENDIEFVKHFRAHLGNSHTHNSRIHYKHHRKDCIHGN